MNEKEVELLITELKNRIGQIVSDYETQLAAVKVQAHTRIEELEAELAQLQGTDEE